jgi:ribonuclease R
LNSLLSEVVGKKEQNLVDTLTIRTMSKAKYSTDNIAIMDWHLIIILILHHLFVATLTLWYTVCCKYYLDGGKSEMKEIYEAKCLHSSTMEG